MNKINNIQQLNKIIETSSFKENNLILKELISDEELRWYFISKLPGKIDKFEELDFLWELLFEDIRPFQTYKIFKRNITSESYEYIINFLTSHYKSLDKKMRDDLFQNESIEIVQEILEKHPSSIDISLNFVKYVLSLRKNAYKNMSTKRDFERERKAILKLLKDIFAIYLEKEEKEKLNEVIQLLDKYLNIVGDDGKYSHYASPDAFQILKDYIDEDFENNFNKIVSLLINQYKDNRLYKDRWKGWELIGSGISQSGSDYSIADRHFITMALTPSLEKYYKEHPTKAWKFIIEKYITRDEKNINVERPDFLNRATIPLLLEEYSSGKNWEAAFKILQDFIQMRNGIPHKTEIIFLAVYANNFELSDDKKWDLVNTQLGYKPYKKLPANVFVQRITSDLANKGNKKAIKAVISWPESKIYRQQQHIGGFMVTENTWKLLDNKETFEDGLSSFKTYISSKEFQDDLDTFEAWDVAKAITKILVKNQEAGLEILGNIWKIKSLTNNQQIIACDSIHNLSDEDIEVGADIFNKFLKPNLKDLTITEIEEKFSYNHARVSLIKFAEKLAKKRKFKEALWLVEKFINDSDPYEKDEKKNLKEGLTRHQQVLNGEDPISIDTIRGWCAWVLKKFTVVDGQQYLDKVIELVEELTQDDNYYVRLQSCVPLMSLVRARHTVLPDTRERFMTFAQAKKIEDIAFSMLDNSENHKLYAVMKNIARTFSYMRSLLDDQAIHVIKSFTQLDFSNNSLENKEKDLLSSAIEEVTPLFIFYAEFRKNAFKASKNKKLFGDELWKQLNKFNAKPFKDLLKDFLVNANDGVRSNLAWQFWKLPREKDIVFERGFKLSLKYMSILVKKYSHGVFDDIYYFIEENIEEKPNDCLVLWKKCLKKEKPYFKKYFNDETWYEMSWWPFFHNGTLLKLVADREGDKEFLKWFDFLVDYPKRAYIANDLDVAIEHLQTFPKDNEDVKKLFEKLILRNAKYFDDMEKWKSK